MHRPTSRLQQPIAIMRAVPSAARDRYSLQPVDHNRGNPASTRAPRELMTVSKRCLAETSRERMVAGQRRDPGNEGVYAVWLTQKCVPAVLEDLPDVGSITGENGPARAHVQVELQRDHR